MSRFFCGVNVIYKDLGGSLVDCGGFCGVAGSAGSESGA